MKSQPFQTRGALCWLLTGFLLAVAHPALAASNPTITGTSSSLSINDTQTATVFSNAVVTVGNSGSATNWITVTVTFNATNLGTLAPLPAGVVQSGTNYIIGPDVDTNVTDTLQLLVFHPVANYVLVGSSSNAVFRVTASDDNGNDSVTRQTTVTVSALNDAPTFSATGTANITDKQTANPFNTISLTDPDNSGTQAQTITVTLSNTNAGYLLIGSSGFTSNNFTYTYTGAPNTVSNALDALIFQPVENALPVGASDTNIFRIVDSDGSVSVTNTSVKVIVLSVNDAPTVTGGPTNHVPIATGHTLTPSPLQTMTLRDDDHNDSPTNSNGQTLVWTATLSGPSPLGQLTVNGNPVGTSYGGTDEPGGASDVLRTVNYLPPLQTISGTNTLTLTLTANDQHGGTLTNLIYFDLYSIVLPPGLSGTQSGQFVNDNANIAPFSKVLIQSHNGSPVTVNVQIANATNDIAGQFINLGSFSRTLVSGAASIYSFSGTSEAATAAIEALLFQPTANRIKGGTHESVVFNLQLIDGAITNAPDPSTSVDIYPLNDAPTIFGISPLVTIQDNQTLKLFSTVLIGDVDESGLQTNRCTILLDDPAKGVLTNDLTSGVLTNLAFTATNNSYVFVGSPADITTAIRRLVFVPAQNRVAVGLTENTTFSVKLNDNFVGSEVVNSATVVRVAAVNGKPVISVPTPQPVSLPVATNVPALGGVSISDATFLKVALKINNTNQGKFLVSSLKFTNSGNVITFTNLGGGNYFATGFATNINPAMQQLVFVPATNLAFGAVINFTISVTNALPNNSSANHAITLRTVRNSFIVTKLTDYDPADNSVAANLKLGTLRNAIASAKSGDHVTFDIRSGSPSLPDYPATIRLVAPITLNSDLTFDGPGADRLTISGDSNSDGTPDVQLFTVNAKVVVNRLAFDSGYASDFGGAFEVNATGNLKLSYCSVTGCRADQYGGGVDVDGGTFNADHCLFKGNSTSSALGFGGGAISLYTHAACTIYASTFATNSQLAIGGYGGGAIYAETDDAGSEFDVNIVACSFHDNDDKSNQGSSISPNSGNTVVHVQNSIFADGHGGNLGLDQGGTLVSFGGNISDDNTYSVFSIGGDPFNHNAFHSPLDMTNIPATNIFSALANNLGPTPTFALINGSPALDNSISNTAPATFAALLGTDQRGYFRTNTPDIGAFEQLASQRIIIEEIGHNPPAPNTNAQFVEFYVPRDSSALDIGGFKVLCDGVLIHTFTSQVLQPGEAIVLCSAGAPIAPPSYQQFAANNLNLNREGGVITLLDAADRPVFEADYVGAFVANDPQDYGSLTNANQSLVLSPQFQGVFLPYQRVVNSVNGVDITGLSNPGYDAGGRPLTSENAPPLAFPDTTATDAHTAIAAFPALANDVDPDVTDTIQVVGVGLTNSTPSLTNSPVGYSALGALLTLGTNGASIVYDPSASVYLQQLPQGSNVVDTFQYTIHDFAGSTAQTNDYDALNVAKATATVTVYVTGVNTAPVPLDDSVTTDGILTTPEDTLLNFTTANHILSNDYDTNTDDSSATLKIISICSSNAFIPNATNLVTALGASVWLDIRFDRNETHIVYDPTNSAILNALNAGQAINDTFYYTVEDRYGARGTAAISIRVTGVDDGPAAAADAFTADEDTAVTLPKTFFLANDTDPDNSAVLDIAGVSPFSAAGASVTIMGTNVVYDPTVSTNLNALAQKEWFTDSFAYTLTDEWGMTYTTNVTVTVTGLNDRPVSAPDFYTTNEDSFLTVPVATGVLANDFDYDTHDKLRVLPFTINSATNCYTLSTGGAPVIMDTNGSFTFDPRGYFNWLKQGEIYNDTFQYVVMDHSLSIAGNDNFSVNTGTSSNTLPVLANDSVMSAAGGAFSITAVSTPDHGGTVSINAAHTGIIYTPATGYVGTETFSYTNYDGLGATDWATVTVNVLGSTLFALPDAFTVAKGTTNVLNLLGNDTIIPATGGNVTITALGTPDHGGTVTFNGNGPNNAVNYTPDPSATAPYAETFSYVVTSASLAATGTVTVTVLDRANALSFAANDDRFTVIGGSGNNVLDVLTNDLILPGVSNRFSVSNLFITGFNTNGLTGIVSVNPAANRLLYKPGAGITNQSESFTYTFSDGAGGSGSASVLVQVVASGFVANDDYFTIYKNGTNSLPLMVNDTLLPNLGQTLFISGIGFTNNAPQHGTVTINGPGNGLTYVPTPGYTGTETFTYEITDGTPARALGHVHLTILDNSTAKSNPDTFRVARESVNNVLQVLTNDYTLPATPGALRITALQTNGVHATVSINGTGMNNALLFSPNSGFIGRDSFSYVFTDSYGNLGTNLVTVTVGDLAPQDDSFYAVSGSANNGLDVRANDFAYPDTNALRKIYALGTPDNGGTVTVNSNATLVLYTPTNGFTGLEHFSYTLADDTTNLFSANVTVNVRLVGSDRDTNTVTIAVVGVNDLPTIVGTQNHFHITDKMTVQPFTNVVTGDIDECGYQTNTLTVSLDNAVKGVLTNLGGFVAISPGVYQMQDSPPALTASLKTLVFVPTENRIIVPNSETTRFTIVANDGYGAPQVDTNTTVIVDSVNDAPVIAGAQGGFQINDKQTVQPFTNVLITEVDDLTLQTNIATVSLDLAAKGVLTNLGNFVSTAPGIYKMTNTAANITASLKFLRFIPTENRITVPTTEVTTLTISMNDGFTPAPITNNATTIFVTATNDPSTIAGTQGGYQITDKQTLSPFTNVVIADVDDLTVQPLNVTVALDLAAKGVLQNLGGFTNSAPGIYTMTGVATNVSASVRNLVFRPTENRIIVPNSETSALTITVNDGFQLPFVVNSNTTITVASVNDAPTITGTATNSITDKQTVQPFSTVTFADVDNLAAVPPQPQLLTVRIAMDNLDKGSLQNLGGFTVVSNGVFQLQGFAPAVTTAIRGITFVPVENHIVVPNPATIRFAISADDGFVAMPTTNSAAVIVTPVNDAPVITGTVSNQLVYNRSFIRPFVGVKITEVDNDTTQALRCTITLNNPTNGNLSQLGGFTDLGGGVYSYGSSNGTVTAAAITTAIRGLLFTPTTASRVSPGVSEVTRFTIRVDDFFAPTVVDSNTTVIAIAPQVGKVTAGDRSVNAQFGWSVANTRDLAVIGAPHDPLNTNTGSAYLFARSTDGSNTWTQIKKLVPPDGHNGDGYGTAVAIGGDTIVIGSPLDNSPLTDAGSAYIYNRNQGGANQWGLVKKIVSPSPVTSDQFGSSVTISSNTIIVGVPLADGPSLDANGFAYIFERNQGGSEQWGVTKKLSAAVPVSNDRFGTAVSISGDEVAVGMPFYDITGAGDAGAVCIFGRNEGGSGQWGLVKTITASDAAIGDNLGASISLYNGVLIAGSPFAITNHSGAAYLFARNQGGANQWGQFKKLTASDPAANDHFGEAVSLYLDTVVVGASHVTNSTGAAYLFGQNYGGTNQWGQMDRLQPSTLSTLDAFGAAVAVFDKTVVIGAYNGLDSGVRYGTAFMFRLKFGNPPQIGLPLVNQTVTASAPLAYTIAAGSFTDPDFNETLTLSVGAVPTAPAWVNFDPLSNAFSGIPGAVGSYPVSVVATDTDGLTASNSFTINVITVPVESHTMAMGFQTFGVNRVTVVTVNGTAGTTYKLQRTPSLSGSVVWTDVATGTVDGTGSVVFTDSTAADVMFYRAVPQ